MQDGIKITELKVKGEGQATTTKSHQLGRLPLNIRNGVMCNCRIRKRMHCSLSQPSQLTSLLITTFSSRFDAVQDRYYVIIFDDKNLAMAAITVVYNSASQLGCCLLSLPPPHVTRSQYGPSPAWQSGTPLPPVALSSPLPPVALNSGK